jgi:RNA polymerase sigma-70 factor (ECF subfamily)
MQMHCARRSFVRGADVVPWAFAIARRLHIDGHRRGQREVLDDSGPEDAPSLDGRPSSDASPDELVAAQQLASLAEAELHRLPPLQREAWRLVRDEGLSVEEAAQVLGTTATAVKLRAHRAYTAIRAALGLSRAEPRRGGRP